MRQHYRVIAVGLFISTLTLFGAGALKPNQNTSGQPPSPFGYGVPRTTAVSIQSNTAIYQPSSIPPVAIMTPDNCSAPFPISPMITLPSGETMRCPAQAAQTTVSSSPQLPPPCVVPGVNDWCPAWSSKPYDGAGHKSDSPGNGVSTKIMATSTDGKFVFIAATSDQSTDSSTTNYEAVTIAYDSASGNMIWATPYIAPTGLQSYSQSLAVGGSHVFVAIFEAGGGQFGS